MLSPSGDQTGFTILSVLVVSRFSPLPSTLIMYSSSCQVASINLQKAIICGASYCRRQAGTVITRSIIRIKAVNCGFFISITGRYCRGRPCTMQLNFHFINRMPSPTTGKARGSWGLRRRIVESKPVYTFGKSGTANTFTPAWGNFLFSSPIPSMRSRRSLSSTAVITQLLIPGHT